MVDHKNNWSGIDGWVASECTSQTELKRWQTWDTMLSKHKGLSPEGSCIVVGRCQRHRTKRWNESKDISFERQLCIVQTGKTDSDSWRGQLSVKDGHLQDGRHSFFWIGWHCQDGDHSNQRQSLNGQSQLRQVKNYKKGSNTIADSSEKHLASHQNVNTHF